jgi:hypothetical protein
LKRKKSDKSVSLFRGPDLIKGSLIFIALFTSSVGG